VLSRARRKAVAPRGYLLAAENKLLWWAGRPARPLSPGEKVAIAELRSWGDSPVTVARFEETERWQHVAGFMGGDTLTLYLRNSKPLRLKLFDPERLPLLLKAFERE